MTADLVVGVDVGGSRVRAALVDVNTGECQRAVNEPTVESRRPEAIVRQVATIVSTLAGSGPVGVTLPGEVYNGSVGRAVNLHPDWWLYAAGTKLTHAIGRPVAVLNDADAAGLAEVRRGAALGHSGTVLMLTFGTGIGSALFVAGELTSGTELGQMPIDGSTAERLAARRVIREDALDWPQWASRANAILTRIEEALSPDLIVIGGGIVEDATMWSPLLHTRATWVKARFGGNAGMVGAALQACEEYSALAIPP